MHEKPCPVKITLSLIANKWKALIIFELLNGTKRYGQIKKALQGITQKVLTENLRSLEEDKLIYRTVYEEIPMRVEYSLTELGLSLNPLFNHMYCWGKKYLKICSPVSDKKSPANTDQIVSFTAPCAKLNVSTSSTSR